MARRGRPVLGAKLAQGTEGSKAAQQRLAVMLATLAGTITIDQACRKLGIGRSRFHTLRNQLLQQAAVWLEPRPRGPRPQVPDLRDQQLQQLQEQVTQLKLDLYAAQVREELALVMPHVLKRPAADEKKTKRPARQRNSRPSGSSPTVTPGARHASRTS